MQPSIAATAQRSQVGLTHPPAGSSGGGGGSLGPRRLPSARTARTHRGGAGHPGGATPSPARVPRHEAHLTPHGRPPQLQTSPTFQNYIIRTTGWTGGEVGAAGRWTLPGTSRALSFPARPDPGPTPRLSPAWGLNSPP
uniref:Uncharacterized protein n=1 Tax=Mustela putorius furo TaxID=9669 RepID=M3XQ73_MUSPF